MSTFTPNLNLQLQSVNENNGTWGTILNTNVITLIDNALGGTYSANVAGNTDITLTTAQAGNLIHNLTGILTGNINYVFPANTGRLLIIKNATTGSFAVTVKGSGGTGVAVTQGTTSLIYIDTSTSTAYIPFSASNLGALSKASNLSDVANAATSLSNLGGAPLASPTFTGTPVMPTGTTAVTQAAGNSTTALATTAFVNSTALTLAAGSTAVTQTAADSTTKVATTAFVNGTALTLAGGSTAVTQSASDNSTKIATTAYVDGAGGSGYVLLSTVNASASATVTFNSTLLTSTYTKYVLEIDSLVSSNSGADLTMTISTNNGSTYLATNYFWGGNVNPFNSATPVGKAGSTPDTTIPITLNTGVLGASGNSPAQITIRFSNPSAAKNFIADWTGIVVGSGSSGVFFAGAAANSGTTAINNIKFTTSGTITGNFNLYGIK